MWDLDLPSALLHGNYTISDYFQNFWHSVFSSKCSNNNRTLKDLCAKMRLVPIKAEQSIKLFNSFKFILISLFSLFQLLSAYPHWASVCPIILLWFKILVTTCLPKGHCLAFSLLDFSFIIIVHFQRMESFLTNSPFSPTSVPSHAQSA